MLGRGEGGRRLAHIEAGLRSGDLAMPEERNRIEVDRIADLLLCPDDNSRATLEVEGVPGTAAVVGDVMADAARLFVPLARERFPTTLAPGSYLVATVHREANVDGSRLSRIVEGLNGLSEPVVLPGAPTHARRASRFGLRLAPHISVAAARLPRARVARVAGASDPDRLGRAAEGGVLVRRPLRHAPPLDRVDGHGAGRSERPRRRRSRDAIVAAVAAARMPDDPPVLYGDGHASERVAQAL